ASHHRRGGIVAAAAPQPLSHFGGSLRRLPADRPQRFPGAGAGGRPLCAGGPAAHPASRPDHGGDDGRCTHGFHRHHPAAQDSGAADRRLDGATTRRHGFDPPDETPCRGAAGGGRRPLSDCRGQRHDQSPRCLGRLSARHPLVGVPAIRYKPDRHLSVVPAGEEELKARMNQMRVAVLVPCYNEEAAIAKGVADFRAALPEAAIYVYDNNSRDRTVERAVAAGAVVRTEQRQGKGNVVRRMFADIEADIYVLVDGDDTYDAGASPRMITRMIEDGADLLTARRIHTDAAAYRPGHVVGNRLLTGLTALLFRVHLSDMLSGYRVFSRRFVKSFPFTAEGFAIETELTVHAVRLMMPMSEMDCRYKEIGRAH